MTDTNFNFKNQTKETKDNSGNITSTEPIHDGEGAASMEAHNLINELLTIAEKFPSTKFVSELNGVPEVDFKELKKDLDHISTGLTDHGSKFFYQITPNSVLIVHQEI